MKVLLFVLFGVFGVLAVDAQNQVVLTVKDGDQSNLMGYSFTKNLAQAVYPELFRGKVKIFKDPNKRTPITIRQIQAIERDKIPFFESNYLILYDLWTIEGNTTAVQTKGIAFGYIDEKQKITNFGFIDAKDIDQILRQPIAPLDMNGNAAWTYHAMLQNLNFKYTIEYFNNKPINDKRLSQAKIEKVFFEEHQLKDAKNLQASKKRIYYQIASTSNQNQHRNDSIYSTLNHFINHSKEDILNSPFGTYFDYLDKKTFAIAQINVAETWELKKEGIEVVINHIDLTLSDKTTIEKIPMSQLKQWEIFIDGNPIETIVVDKQFQYTINQINEEPLPNPALSDVYREALLQSRWTNIKIYPDWVKLKPYLKY